MSQFEQIGSITPTQETRLGRMLSGGRLTATMLSKKSQRHVTLTMESKKKVGNKWEHVLFAEASHVFIKMGQGGYGSIKLATYYGPEAKPSLRGKLYFDTPDKAWRYAVMETLRAAVTGQQETDKYTITESHRCGVCGLELTNYTSIKLGIGPTCEEKWLGTSTSRSQHYQRDEANLVEDTQRRVREITQRPSPVPGNRPITVERTESAVTMHGGTLRDRKGRNVPRTFEALAAAVKS